jgi:hypothetical protein
VLGASDKHKIMVEHDFLINAKFREMNVADVIE